MDQSVKEAKCVLLGGANVGKTSISQRFVRNEFSPQQQPTNGAAFLRHAFKVDGQYVKLQLWDTAGQEKFRSVSAMYYRGAAACVIVFDASDASSLDDARYWRQQLRASGVADAATVLVANKIDLPRAISREDGEIAAREMDCAYAECSAKSGEGVKEMFESLARQHLKPVEPQLNLDQPKKGCCSK